MNVAIFLVILSVIAGAIGALFVSGAQTSNSAIHEIEGLICLLAAAVLLSGAFVVSAVMRVVECLKQQIALDMKTPTQKADASRQAILDRVRSEIESGSIDKALWAEAVDEAGSTSKSVSDVYFEKRVNKLAGD